MEALLSFLIKSSLSLIVFYICYKAFLSNETFFRFNRYVILFGIILCLGISFFEIDFIQGRILSENEIIGTATAIPIIDKPQPIMWGTIISFVYMIGFFVNIYLLMKSTRSLYRIIKHSKKIDYSKGLHLILADKNIAPFSWYKYIIISKTDYEENCAEIIYHETEHIKRKHSLDIIFLEIVSLLFWFNPVIWLLKKELRDIHEYQADMGVLRSGINASKYQLLLIKKAVGSSSYTLANSFNHSKIKKRITMMLKRKSNKWAKLKLACLIPAGLVPAIIFAQPKATQLLAEVTQTTKISDLFNSDKTNDEPIAELKNTFAYKQASELAVPKDTVPPPPPPKVIKKDVAPPPPPPKKKITEEPAKVTVADAVEETADIQSTTTTTVGKDSKPEVVVSAKYTKKATDKEQKTKTAIKNIPDIVDDKESVKQKAKTSRIDIADIVEVKKEPVGSEDELIQTIKVVKINVADVQTK